MEFYFRRFLCEFGQLVQAQQVRLSDIFEIRGGLEPPNFRFMPLELNGNRTNTYWSNPQVNIYIHVYWPKSVKKGLHVYMQCHQNNFARNLVESICSQMNLVLTSHTYNSSCCICHTYPLCTFGINSFESITLVFLTQLLENLVCLAFKALFMFVKSWHQMTLLYVQETSNLLRQLMKRLQQLR